MKNPIPSKSASRLTLSTLLAYAAFQGLSFAATFVGETISVNFVGRNNGGTFGIDTDVGVLLQKDWNMLDYGGGGGTGNVLVTNSSLLYDDGALGTSGTSSVSIGVRAADSWSSGSGSATPQNALLNGIIKANGTNRQPTFSFSGLSPGNYRVIVYTTENGLGGRYSMALGGTTYYQEAQNGTPGTAFIQGTNTTNGTFPVANYVNFASAASLNGSLSLGVNYISGSDGIGIAGIQLQTLSIFKPWSGTVNGNWDGATANWTGGAYVSTDAALFLDFDGNSVPPVTRNITVTAGGITVVGVVVDNSTGDYTFGGGTISGTGGLTKSGTSDLILNATTSYTGGTTINQGTLRLGHATDTLANAEAVTVAGGTLDLGANSDTVGVVTLTNDGFIIGSTGVLTGSSYNVQSGSVSARLGGAGSLTKTTNGTVVLTGLNTYSGGTNINGGVLRANDGSNLPSGLVTFNGGVLETSANFIRTAGAGSGQVQLIGGASGFSAFGGAVVVSLGGLLTPTALTWGGADFNPSSLVLNTSTADSLLEFRNAIDLNGANRTVAVNSTASGTEATLSGVLSGAGGILTKTGNGMLVLTATNTYTGGTTINGGTLKLGAAGALPTSGNVTIGNGGTLDLNGFSRTLPVLNSNGTVTSSGGAVTVTVESGGAQIGFGAVAPGGSFVDGPGVVSLVKTTGGTLALKAASAYTGGTTVTGGTLSIGNNAALGTGPVSLAGGTTLSFGAGSAGLKAGLLSGSFNTGGANPATYLTATTALAGSSSTGAFPGGIPNDSTAVYTGFINNASASPQTWTFAENFDDSVLLKINGSTVLNDGGWNVITQNSVLLQPGYNNFELRLGQGNGGVGPAGNISGSNTNFGVAVAYPAAPSTFVRLPVDNGSGNAFISGAADAISNAVTLNGDATVDVAYSAGASTKIGLASVAMGSGRTLSLTAVAPNTSITATSTSFNGTAGFNVAAGVTYNPGALTGGAGASTITKTGSGTLRVASPATSIVVGSVVNVTTGTLALGGDPSIEAGGSATAIGSSSVTLAGGTTLSLDGFGGGAGLLGRYYNGNPANVGNSNPNFVDYSTFTSYFAGLTPTVATATTTGGKLDFDFSNVNYGNGAPFNGGDVTRGPYGFTNTDNIQATWTGYINVTNAGVARFESRSDDGTMVFIDGNTVVNNNQYQGATTQGGDINLSVGLHQISLGFYEGGGGAGALFQWRQAGDTMHTLLNTEVINYGSYAVNQAFANNVFITGNNATLLVNNSPLASIGALTLGAAATNLNVTTTDALTGAHRVTAASTSLAGNTSFTVTNGAGTVTFAPGAISQTAASALTKNGNGILLLEQASTYTGGTTVTAGTLAVTNATGSATGTGAVTLQSLTKLTGNGRIAGNVSLASGAIFAPGSGVGTTLTLGGSVSIATGSTLNYDFAAPGTSTSATITGPLTITGAQTLNVNELAGFDIGNYTLATASNIPVGATYTIVPTGPTVGLPGIGFNVSIVGGTQLVLGVTNQSIVWTGLNNDQWDNTTFNNWTTVNPTLTSFIDGYTVIFNNSGINQPAVNISSVVKPWKTNFTNSLGNDYVILGVLGGPGGVTKTNTGGVYLTGTNTYTGITSILGGFISISDDANLGAAPATPTAGKLVLDGGTLSTAADFSINSNRGIAVGSTGGSILVDVGANLTYGGVIADIPSQAGKLIKEGAGTLILTNANTFTGGLVVNAGTVAARRSDQYSALSTGPVTVNVGGTLRSDVGDSFGYFAGTPSVISIVGGTVTTGGSGNFRTSLQNVTFTGGTLTSLAGNNGDANGVFSFNAGGSVTTFAAATTALISTPTLGLGNGNNFVFTVADGAAASDLTISSQIIEAYGNGGQTSITKEGAGLMTLSGGVLIDMLKTNGGTTNLDSALGGGGSTLNANATTNISVSQTLAALNIGTVPFAEMSAVSGLAGDGGSAAAVASSVVVPEPGTLGLLVVGGLGILGRRRRRA